MVDTTGCGSPALGDPRLWGILPAQYINQSSFPIVYALLVRTTIDAGWPQHFVDFVLANLPMRIAGQLFYLPYVLPGVAEALKAYMQSERI